MPRHHGVSVRRARRWGVCRDGTAARHHDAANPRRIDAVADTNFSFWHSATFSNDGGMVLFSDEWGVAVRHSRATDPKQWGADAIFTIVDHKMTFKSYYKMPAPQTAAENCVAHNGSLDSDSRTRTVMVQAWYQGGLSVSEWSDPSHPKEIGFFDRGPNDSTRLVGGGFWSAYWYNGHIIGSEMQRGLDVFELEAERRHFAERDRRREDRAVRVGECAGSAEVHLAGELCAGTVVPRPVGAGERPRSREDRGGADGTDQCRETVRRSAAKRTVTGIEAIGRRRWPAFDQPRVRWAAAAVKDLASATHRSGQRHTVVQPVSSTTTPEWPPAMAAILVFVSRWSPYGAAMEHPRLTRRQPFRRTLYQTSP